MTSLCRDRMGRSVLVFLLVSLGLAGSYWLLSEFRAHPAPQRARLVLQTEGPVAQGVGRL